MLIRCSNRPRSPVGTVMVPALNRTTSGTSSALHPPPRQRGRGTTPKGWWRGRRPRRFANASATSEHFRAPASSHNENFLRRKRSGESGAPSTTVRSLRELQWSPSPASRGRKVRPFSRRSGGNTAAGFSSVIEEFSKYRESEDCRLEYLVRSLYRRLRLLEKRFLNDHPADQCRLLDCRLGGQYRARAFPSVASSKSS